MANQSHLALLSSPSRSDARTAFGALPTVSWDQSRHASRPTFGRGNVYTLRCPSRRPEACHCRQVEMMK
eukprot:5823754-Alexandrium_andersonii.AAC.1